MTDTQKATNGQKQGLLPHKPQSKQRQRILQHIGPPNQSETESAVSNLTRTPTTLHSRQPAALLSRTAVAPPRTPPLLTTKPATPIQPKLTVNEPNDAYEQEADRMADAVMRMPEPSPPFPDNSRGPNAIQARLIQRANAHIGRFSQKTTPTVTPDIEGRIQRMKGSGSPLPHQERSFFEQRMGHDFRSVRIHTDSNAIQTSRDINARAFTVGNHIAFNAGEFNPQTPAGKHLLAHELTHTIQQQAAPSLQRQEGETPTEGTAVQLVGVTTANDPDLALRDEPTTEGSTVLERLPFGTRLFVEQEFPGDWYSVTTEAGAAGYVAKMYVRTDLPEPDAQLHLVEAGETAIGIAEQYYSDQVIWGRDLRFYVNVLHHINEGVGIQRNGDDWEDTLVLAGFALWIPSPGYANTFMGILSSESMTYEAMQAMLPTAIQNLINQIRLVAPQVDEVEQVHISDALWARIQDVSGQLQEKIGDLPVSVPSLNGFLNDITSNNGVIPVNSVLVGAGALGGAALLGALIELLLILLAALVLIALLYLIYLLIQALVDAIVQALQSMQQQPPLFWSSLLPLPGPIGMPIIRTKPANPRLPNGEQARVYRQLRQLRLNGVFVAHHILPLMLGGQDIAGNVVPIPRAAHVAGHTSLHMQPQLAIWGYSPWIINNPPPNMYFLAGVKP